MDNLQKLTISEPLTEGGSLEDEKEFTKTTSVENGKKVTRHKMTGMTVEQLLIGAVLGTNKPKPK
jgi:hypothetical protein